jgi:pilus assembly protein CpaF
VSDLPDGLDPDVYHTIKSTVHFRLVERLDLATVINLPPETLAETIREAVREITANERIPLNRREKAILVTDLVNEIVGLGPLEPLMADASIQDILVNGPENVYVEKRGVLMPAPVRFRDTAHLMQIIDRIVSATGRRVDESSPMVDARLPDGSRVNVVIQPLSLIGPALSIRKFAHETLSIETLVAQQSIIPEMRDYLEAAVVSKLNILISGGTGAGKTTFLNLLSGFIPESERIITIEDSAELRLHQPHVVGLEARPGNVEGRGRVTVADLVRNSLRMRPDRIIVGEARGAEVMDMLQAMNTGHPGSMSTIHANSPRDALSRIEAMADMGETVFSERALRTLVSRAINVVVQLTRLIDGRRLVTSISEITGLAEDAAVMHEVFLFEQRGVDDQGNVFGVFRGSGAAGCTNLEHFRSYGLDIDPVIFGVARDVRWQE